MSINVKFFAQLRDTLGHAQCEIDLATPTTVQQVWQAATDRPELPTDVFCAINHQHARRDQTVQNGDEVAFFPQITGG